MEFARLEYESFLYTVPCCDTVDESKREVDIEQKLRDLLKLTGSEEQEDAAVAEEDKVEEQEEVNEKEVDEEEP
jgi:hypothetical protein